MKLNVAFFLGLASLSAPVHAGPFTDEMSKCLIKSTSQADKTLLIKWIFAAMSAHPDVKALSNVSAEKGETLNRDTAGLFMKLLTERCRSQTQDALKYEGSKTFEASFSVLGQVAMQGLMADPEVAKYISGLERHVDTKALQKSLTPKQN